MRTEHRDQASFCPFALREVSVLAELALGHLRYSLTDVPPQSNSPPGSVLEGPRMSPVSLFFVTTSPCREWVICAPAAFLGCGSRFSGSLSGIEP
ncbi:unnamed protein product [Phyllotreta striolata]|uniref:Uncharacterized protein n=1 Tax=Phyllotreta striolata TaxID=444603 RepID=A0A9P0DSJ1_PHYSR|nr:unnamed protein product [Phyllotreta striolata]